MGSNEDYDNTGLMPQIQALIAPPVSDDRSTCSSSSSSSSSRRNKHPYFKRHGKGHNHDLCDACGEGGDLICCDKCPSSFHLQCHDPPLDEGDIPMGEWMCNKCRTKSKRRLSTSSAKSEEPAAKKQSMMDILIDAAKLMNPQKFDLPYNMQEFCDFPGMDKEVKKGQNGSNNAKEANTADLVNSKCFVCSKSGRFAQLIACDYCPLVFHLDCLDPPLTAAPADKWMCPNHVQHYLDSRLLTSISLTERHKLWTDFALKPIDQDAIKVEFFRKVHRENPPFRYKVKMTPRKRANVPGMVKAHYKCPVELLPSLRDVLRIESVLNFNSSNNLLLEKLQNAADFQETEIKQETADVEEPKEQPEEKFEEITIESTAVVKSESKECFADEKNVFLLSSECEQFLETVLKTHEEQQKQSRADCLFNKVQNELKHLDEQLVRVLAFQRLQQVLLDDQIMPLPSQLLTPDDIERIAKIFSSPKRKNIQRLSNPCPPLAVERVSSCLRARAMLCPVVSKYFYNVRNSDGTEVRHDASFMGYRPTVSNRFPEAHSMRYRSLSIGKGSANNLQLDNYGSCNNISPKHAVIFYDEYTKHYELLNYSMHGTYVNNVLYSNHVADRPAPPSAIRTPEMDKQVKEIVDKRRKILKRCKSVVSGNTNGNNSTTIEAKMVANEPGIVRECSCTAAAASVLPMGGVTVGGATVGGPVAAGQIQSARVVQSLVGSATNTTMALSEEQMQGQGWEGSALLHHGSLLRFGCISFVFSIVDCATVG